jgi:poly(A) polymerase
MTLRLPFSAAAADRRMTPGRLLAARRDAIILAQAGARPGHHDEWEPARKFLQDTEEPRLPFSGADFIARGITEGRAIGEALCDLQARWIEAGFPTDPARLARLLDETPRGTP